MAWLPKTLPPFVKLIVSTQDEDTCQAFKNLKKVFNKPNEQVFLNVPNLPAEEAQHILTYW